MGAAEEFVCKVADMGMVSEVLEKVRAYRRGLRDEEDGRYEKLEGVIAMLSGHIKIYADFKERAQEQMEEHMQKQKRDEREYESQERDLKKLKKTQ
jgi:hypothetical protein